MLQMNGLDEMRCESYESSRIYKEKVKLFHDKHIVSKTLSRNRRYFCTALVCTFSQANWTSPFVVKTVHPYGSVEIENPKNGKIIKVNGQRLKPFLENFDRHKSIEELVDPAY